MQNLIFLISSAARIGPDKVFFEKCQAGCLYSLIDTVWNAEGSIVQMFPHVPNQDFLANNKDTKNLLSVRKKNWHYEDIGQF